MPISERRETHTATTPLLHIGYEAQGDPNGSVVVLLHGFPYDVRSYDGVAGRLASVGARVIVPYLRGYGPTRFISDATMRSGQQAALGQDLIDLLDALHIQTATVAGYDWGGRAACVGAALFPERISNLISVGGYNIQDIATSSHHPLPPELEKKIWYQYYFHSERGRRGLQEDRESICSLLWREWSPLWEGATAAFGASAPSLHNPDFVDVVIHSYRHRFGIVRGDHRYDELEQRLATRPAIRVPSIVVDGEADGLSGSGSASSAACFTGPFSRISLKGVGHNPPQEAPSEFAAAIISLL